MLNENLKNLRKSKGITQVSVSELLGTKVEKELDSNIVAEQLSRINEQLAIKNRRSHRIWKTIITDESEIITDDEY